MFKGFLDEADRSVLRGWACDTDKPDRVVRLVVSVDDNLVAIVNADLYRADLAEGAMGAGHHAFKVQIDHKLPDGPCEIRVRDWRSGAELSGSPVNIRGRDGESIQMPGLDGKLDDVTRTQATGWARTLDGLDEPVTLVVSVDGQEVSRVTANRHRPDVEEAGFGSGRHGFVVAFGNALPLSAVTVRVQRELDGADIPNSPFTLAAAEPFGPEVRAELTRVLKAEGSEEDIRQRIAFLAQHMDELLQLRIDRLGRRAERSRQRQLRSRWMPMDAARRSPAAPLRPRALVIDDRLPVADRDAGSQAILSHMRALQRLGFDVHFVPVDMAASVGTDLLDGLGIDCSCSPWTGSLEEVLRREAGTFQLVYVHRMSNAVYLTLIRRYQPKAWLLLSVADLGSLRHERQGQVEKRPELQEYSQRVRASELSAARFVDAVVTHSDHEAALLRTELPPGRVHVVPWSLTAAPLPAGFAERAGLAFVGGYEHAPNVDAAHRLAGVVMPLVWQKDPAITCTLVGSKPPASLQQLAGPQVIVAGHVPDLAVIYGTVRLTVAPLNFGAGVKGKVLESLAAGVPCVCSPVAAEGLAFTPALQQQVASTPAGLAKAILRLHGSGELHGRVRAAGLAHIAARHSEERVDAALRQALISPAMPP